MRYRLVYMHISGTKGFVQCIQVFKERINTKPDLLYDFCDGQLFKEHPLFSVDKHALQLVVYTDEVETVNPLGSYRGQHKLCKYLWILLLPQY